MQEFYPTYETANKFCAGFDVSSMLSSFEPNCPECSMCENDGTDSICMKHANDALGCLVGSNYNIKYKYDKQKSAKHGRKNTIFTSKMLKGLCPCYFHINIKNTS